MSHKPLFFYPSYSTELSEHNVLTIDLCYEQTKGQKSRSVGASEIETLVGILNTCFTDYSRYHVVIRATQVDSLKKRLGAFTEVKSIVHEWPHDPSYDAEVVYEQHYVIATEQLREMLLPTWRSHMNEEYQVWLFPVHERLDVTFPKDYSPKFDAEATTEIVNQAGCMIIRDLMGMYGHVMFSEQVKERTLPRFEEKYQLQPME